MLSLDEIQQALRALTKERRAGVDDMFFRRLQEALTPDAPRKLNPQELREREKELEAQLFDWWLIWDQANQSYGIIPRE